mmetsp:Transcript_3230/g.4215  ORF Transcript_3230/g.4215 Transcript_3230/m.4215 type:complete len:231 (+) Transcript_3230:656-1348(+)
MVRVLSLRLFLMTIYMSQMRVIQNVFLEGDDARESILFRQRVMFTQLQKNVTIQIGQIWPLFLLLVMMQLLFQRLIRHPIPRSRNVSWMQVELFLLGECLVIWLLLELLVIVNIRCLLLPLIIYLLNRVFVKFQWMSTMNLLLWRVMVFGTNLPLKKLSIWFPNILNKRFEVVVRWLLPPHLRKHLLRWTRSKLLIIVHLILLPLLKKMKILGMRKKKLLLRHLLRNAFR